MGKTFRSAVDEAVKCAWACRYYAENAERFLADEDVATNAKRSYVKYQPLGVGARGHAVEFSLLAGLPLHRAGPDGGQCRPAQARVERPPVRARDRRDSPPRGLPGGRIPDSPDRREQVDARPRRSARRRRHTHRQRRRRHAGRESRPAKQIKKIVLELGGSDPFIVMPSADLDEAVEPPSRRASINNGQSCIAAKRFIVAGAKSPTNSSAAFVEAWKR